MTSHEDFSAEGRDDRSDDQTDELVSVGEIVAFANHHLVRQAQLHPYRTLGAALGVGYVLGAGMPRFVVRLARIMAIRSATETLIASDSVQQALQSLWQKVQGQGQEEDKPRKAEGSSASNRRKNQRERRSGKSNLAGETTH